MDERLFLALWPPDDVVRQIDAALPRDLTALRWQSPDRWHITLAFLGKRSVANVVQRFDRAGLPAAGEVCVNGCGAFGPVMWVGVDAAPWLTRMASDLQRHFGVQERRFQAHVTVARARSTQGRAQLRDAVVRIGAFRSSAWTPTEVTLVRSVIGPSPSYEVIGRRPLPGP